VKFTRAITKGVQAELEDLASWLGLDTIAASDADVKGVR